MSLKLNSSGGGSVTLSEPTTASNRTLNLPDADATVLTDSAGVLNIGSGQVYKDASGNVGIGTSSPGRRLDVSGASSAGADIAARVTNTDSNSSSRAAVQVKTGTSANVWQMFCRNNQLVFGVDTVADYATIDSSGNLLIARTDVVNQGRISVNMLGGTNVGLSVVNTNSGNTGNFCNFARSDTTVIGSIQQNGSSAVTYSTSSDYRLKENVQPMTGALAKIAALKPVTYKWKIDGSDGEGFIAHELAEVCPGAVTGEKDAVNEDGSIKPQGIDTSFLVATLTAAIQEQQQMIETLQAKVAALEAA